MQEKDTFGRPGAGKERRSRRQRRTHSFLYRSAPRGPIRFSTRTFPGRGARFLEGIPLAPSLRGECRCGLQIPFPELERDPTPLEMARLRNRRAQHQTNECMRANPRSPDPLFRPDFVGSPPVHEATDPIVESSRAYQNTAARTDRHGQPFSWVLCNQGRATGPRHP